MSLMNDILNTATYGESDRLDWVVKQLETLQARQEALSALLVAKGLLTVDELARMNSEPPAAVTNEELDQLDTNVR
jgi:hypothetical protein